MLRREFLVLSVFAPLLARAGGLDCPPPAERRQVVHHGLALARAAAKPLLVLVAPQTPDYRRGSAFGQWLNHGGDVALADVAQVVVVVASLADVRAELPRAPGGGDPALLFIWDDVVTPLSLSFELTESERGRGADADPAIDRNIKLLRDALRGELTRTRAARVARCPAVVGKPEQLSAAQVDAVAARLAEMPDQRAALANAARQRVVKARIPGSYWAVGSGCGETVEELPASEQQLVKCGMGFVPERSRRFIRFFSCDA